MASEKIEYEKGYPTTKYRPIEAAPGFEAETVKSSVEEAALGEGWYSSPSDFGLETCPGRKPDPEIAAKRRAFEAGRIEAEAEVAPIRRPGRPKKSEVPSGGDAA